MKIQRLTVGLAYGAICLIWGTTWLAIKIGLHGLGPLTGVGIRFIIAGAVLYGVAAMRRELRTPRDVPWRTVGVLAVLLFGCNYVLMYVAETRLDSGLVAVLFGTLPFFTFAFSHVLLGERAAPRVWIGALVAFAGVAAISLAAGTRGSLLFALAPIGAAAAAAFANVYAKRHAYPPLVTLPPAMTLAGTCVLMVGLVAERTPWAQALQGPPLAALLYLAVFGSAVAFFLLMWLLQRLSASIVGTSTLVFPVVAIAVGTLAGGEHVTLRELCGAALVVAGLAIVLARTEPSGVRLKEQRA